jgi:hypothetical protein
MLRFMKRLQIMIEEDLDEELGRLARAEGSSKAALIRRYVREHIMPLPPIEEDPLWDLVGLVGDRELPKNPDGSEPSIDEVVYEWPSSTPPSGSPSRTRATRATRTPKHS